MLFVVGAQIVECEAIMSGNKINTIDRFMMSPLIKIGATCEAGCNLLDNTRIAFDKLAN